jgi:bacillithiol synthase
MFGAVVICALKGGGSNNSAAIRLGLQTQYVKPRTSSSILSFYMASVRHVPFRAIPNQSALFLDYVEFSARALRFFQCPPTIDALVQNIRDRIASRQYHRPEIASIVRRQNESFGCDSATMSRIGELEKPDCFAVLTGQQVGLFTGPLYTLYKALTAINLADELQKHGVQAVPIFWMDTEDHDLAEVSHQTVFAPAHSLQSVDYGAILWEDARVPKGSVGSIRFTENIKRVVSDYVRQFPDSTWKHYTQAQLESTYSPGASFSQAFARLLSQILRGYGLILFDPMDAEAKRLASGVFRRALCNAGEIHGALVRRNRELEISGYHSQVNILDNSTVIFYNADGERLALERRQSGFALKTRDTNFSLQDLLDRLEEAPENFSPNVLLRPLVQDSLFPTAAYVGGPAEVAYFAQIETLYQLFGHPMPAIWPRNSCTLLEPTISEAMTRLGLDFLDCFRGKDEIREKALRNTGYLGASGSVEALQWRVEALFTEIGPEILALDPSLTQALETAKRKILHNFQHLRSHLVRAEGSRASSVFDAVDMLLSHCFPGRKLQERELGIHQFLAHRGPSLLETVRSRMEAGNFTHHVIQLD